MWTLTGEGDMISYDTDIGLFLLRGNWPFSPLSSSL